MRLAAIPRPIRLFAALWMTQALLTLVYGLLNPASVTGGLAAQSQLSDLAQPVALVGIFGRLALSVLTLWLVVRKGSNLGRWLAVVLEVFRLRGVPLALSVLMGGDWLAALWLGGTLLGLGAVAVLFGGSGAQWFAEAPARAADR